MYRWAAQSTPIGTFTNRPAVPGPEGRGGATAAAGVAPDPPRPGLVGGARTRQVADRYGNVAY